MKIIATSDMHGILPKIPECDLLLIGGDICPDFIREYYVGVSSDSIKVHKGHNEQAKWLSEEFKLWLEQVPAKWIVGIAGNHDFVFESPHMVPEELPWIYLQDQVVNVNGIRIYGMPWVPNLPFWAFHAGDEVLKRAYEAIEECDILISHGPPLGVLDEAPSKYGSKAGENAGSKYARFAIERIKPKYYICGHIHEGYGQFEYKHSQGITKVLNVAHMSSTYDPPYNDPVELS